MRERVIEIIILDGKIVGWDDGVMSVMDMVVPRAALELADNPDDPEAVRKYMATVDLVVSRSVRAIRERIEGRRS